MTGLDDATDFFVGSTLTREAVHAQDFVTRLNTITIIVVIVVVVVVVVGSVGP